MVRSKTPTLIAVYVDGASNRRQRELAAYLAKIARAAAEGVWEDVRVEIPAGADPLPPYVVQPGTRDDGQA